MTNGPVEPVFEPFLLVADAVAAQRPDVDPAMAREVFIEAATLLHNGLVLDGLTSADAAAVVHGLSEDLIEPDPGAAIRARAMRMPANASGYDDVDAARAAYLNAAAVLQL